ncbi:MAG: DUF4254 domain-containing protein [Pirellula sp.]|nr:DUF4254 domain-containing protein [Pirellula sp.]
MIEVTIDIDEILGMQIRTTADWHSSEVANVCDDGSETQSLISIACQQHIYNYLLWHEEDIARSKNVSDAEIAQVKRNIDVFNQNRNDWIERIDDWIADDLLAANVTVRPDARLNTETPGSVFDRLSILSLRMYHLREQLEREDVDDSHIDMVQKKLAICRLQHDELSQSLRELLEDIYAGAKRHRTYRQFKMYNDPTLNPYLYDPNKAIE